MQSARIEFLPSAQADIDHALDYLLEKDIRAAEAFLDDIERATGQLQAFPEASAVSRDERLANDGYRVMLLIYEYLLFYRVHDDKFYVYRVVDGRRNYGT